MSGAANDNDEPDLENEEFDELTELGSFVLLVVDEASGVPEAVFEAAAGSMSTSGAISILTGNPTRSSGFFWKTHNTEADRWWTARVSSIESRRVDQGFAFPEQRPKEQQ